MKLFAIRKDGGAESTVWGLFLVEIKSLFSVALLCFEDGSRDAYHSHAFDCVSWVLRGRLEEDVIVEGYGERGSIHYRAARHVFNIYRASLLPVITRRSTMHKVTSGGRTWVLTFRGPWARTWREYLPREQRFATLTHGRVEV
jgi:hypothetical protein